MYIVLYMFNIKISSILEIRMGFFAIAAASMFGGPIFGLAVGTLGDLMSMVVTGGQGASYFVGFTISYALMGFLFGLVFYGGKLNVLKAMVGAFFQFVISAALNTFWLSIYYGMPFKATLISRLPKSIAGFVVSTVLFVVLLPALKYTYVIVLNENSSKINASR